MIYKWKNIIILLIVVAFISFDTQAKDPFPITILHTNDIHGRSSEFHHAEWNQMAGGFARLATAVQEARARNPYTLLFDAGDLFSGTAICSLTEGRVMLLGAALTGYDAIVVGNHEFDYGQDLLTQYIEHSAIPLISANVQRRANNSPYAPGYLFFELNDVTILVIGLTTPTTVTASHPHNVVGLKFTAPVPVVRRLQKNYADDYDVLIVLSHLGHAADRRLAANLTGIDLIIGGHSHSRLEESVQVEDTIIVQAYQWGLYLGRVDLYMEGAVVQDISASLLPMNESVVPNPLVESIVESWVQTTSGVVLQEVVGSVPEVVTRSASWWVGDSPLGNLVTDALLWSTGADFAVYNNGGLRADLAAGPITLDDLYRVEPFGSSIRTLELSGRQVEQLFRHMAARGGEQIAGATYTVVGSLPEDITIRGVPLAANEQYTLAVSDFLAAGGSNYWMLPRAEVLEDHGLVRDAISAFFLAHPHYVPAVQGRIRWRQP